MNGNPFLSPSIEKGKKNYCLYFLHFITLINGIVTIIYILLHSFQKLKGIVKKLLLYWLFLYKLFMP